MAQESCDPKEMGPKGPKKAAMVKGTPMKSAKVGGSHGASKKGRKK